MEDIVQPLLKKDDLVRAIDIGDFNSIVLGKLYIVDRFKGDTKNVIYNMIQLTNFNEPGVAGGFYSYRFKKVSAEDLTEKEKFKYIKWKLGIKSNKKE